MRVQLGALGSSSSGHLCRIGYASSQHDLRINVPRHKEAEAANFLSLILVQKLVQHLFKEHFVFSSI